MGSLDVSDLSHSSSLQCCLWGWVGCTAVTLVKAAEGNDLPAPRNRLRAGALSPEL